MSTKTLRKRIALVAVSAMGFGLVSTVADAAVAGTVETRPKPKAATATSAMRLRSVFVDICFLSISRSTDYP